MLKTIRMVASGRVQGVGFRAFVKDAADDFGLTGYVQNLFNGEVRVVATGEEAFINRFIDIIRRGNGHSRIEALEIDYLDRTESSTNFSIKRTE
ncbi:MAG: acylphosphatase [Calditrichaeota bacterium]|nr:acylphosphatase [Calditrichota bacterium]